MTRPPEADRTAARKGDDTPVSQPPPKPSFWRTLRVVAWGFLGVRKNSEYQRDLAQINPFHVILAGLIGVVLLVVLLLVIVNWVVAGATPSAQVDIGQNQALASAKQAQAAIN